MMRLRYPSIKQLLFALSLWLLAVVMVASSQRESVWLYGGGVFAPHEGITLEAYLGSQRDATLRIYRILNPEMVLKIGGPQFFEASEQLELKPVRDVSLRHDHDRYYTPVEVGRLPIGMYFAQLESGTAKRATLMVVTNLSLVVKTDTTTTLTYTAERQSGAPQQAQIYLLHEETSYAEGMSATDGLATFTTEGVSGLVVAARAGDAWAFSNSYWSRWSQAQPQIYLQTDRPVYRPGQTVYFKGTARAPQTLTPLVEQTVELIIRDADYKEIASRRFTTDAYGSFDGELRLTSEPPLGTYRLEARILGATSQGTFEVQAYQKPEYRVSVTPQEALAVQGEDAVFTIVAEYLFGGAVGGGQVSYTVLKQPHYRWRYRSRFGFYEDYSYSGFYGSDLLTRGEGVLNAQGELVVTVPLPAAEEDYQLVLQAGVTDEARREISASAAVTAYRAGVTLNVRTDRYAHKAGDPVQVTVEAEDLHGNPVSVPFQLTAERYYWERSAGQRSEALEQLTGVTDSSGRAVLTLEPSQGLYTLRVTAQDSAGRETTASGHLWVSGSERWYWAYDRLDVTVDKEEYTVGETARFVIQSPVADAYALITQEGQALASYEVVQLEGSVLTYELVVTEDMTPNSFVSVVIIGGGTTYQQTVGFRVPPVNKFLNVDITSNSDTFKPGETGVFDLRVSDVNGRGLSTQLTLALVDEGIFLVRPDQIPDIRGFFYALRGNLVGTQLSDWYYFGDAAPVVTEALPMSAAPQALERSADAEVTAPQDFADAELREDFQDTILWLPTIETEDDGRATIEVVFPDNLTEWRLTARAISLYDHVGQNSYSVTTTLPVIARLAAPRFFVRGDSASLRVIGQSNLLMDELGRLELETENLRLDGVTTEPAVLPAGGRTTADFTVQADVTGTAVMTATALTRAASDAMRLSVPILPYGVRSELAWAGSGTGSWTFTLPSGTDINSVRGALYLTPSLAAAVSPALAYLAGYPYGCTEQTMSRFYPSVLAAQAGDLARLPDDIASNLDDIVAKGLARIYDFQHSSGGWGFWQHDSSNPFITAYVLNGLLDAQAAGYPVRESVVTDGLNYLERVIQGTFDSTYRVVDADAKAYAYYALARAGREVTGLAALAGRRDMSPYGLSLSVLAYHELNQTVEANLYLDELMSRMTERSQVAYWETGAPRYFWNDDRIEATAYALMALVQLRPDEPRIGKIVNWLLLERQGARWVSTKDTAAVVKAALLLAERTGEEGADYRVSVTLDGAELLNTRILGQSPEGMTLELPQLPAGRHQLALQVEGSGTLYASANVSYVAEQGSFTPQREYFDISRSYERLIPVQDSASGTLFYNRTPLDGAVTVGDYVLVTVTIDPKDSYRYVLVNEPLPAGYRVVENDQMFRVSGVTPRYGWDYWGWNYWYDGRDIRDERVDYYFASLGYPVTFTYILRAETPGRFSALPTQAWLMYEPDVSGTGQDITLEIAEQL
jgi:uncharacterized protein YfaS (alpha-2-macroglobulin family)